MRWLRAGFLPTSLMILTAATLLVPLPYVLQRPGRVIPLGDCVVVDKEEATPVNGDYLLMTISVGPATAVDVLAGAFDPETDVARRETVVPPGTNPDSYFADQRRVFDATSEIAAAVGFQKAGLPARITGDGVSVMQVAPDTPAAEALEPGDIITAIDGEAVTNESDLRDAVAAAEEGQALTLRVTRRTESVEVSLTPAIIEGAPRLGVVPETVNPRVTLPVGVEVSTGAVGGPSAGLTIALTVYDMVVPGVDLARGRTVAGTGTIDQDGTVGSVGGAGLKVIAAHRRGASLFLVPAANAAEAAAAVPDGSALEVVPVTSFDDAVAALEQGADTGGTPPAREPCPYDEAA